MSLLTVWWDGPVLINCSVNNPVAESRGGRSQKLDKLTVGPQGEVF